MPRIVIAAVDGTPATETAVPLAVSLAEPTGADVHLLRVMDVSTGTLSARSGLLGVSREADAMRAGMENQLAALGGQHAGRMRGSLTWSVEDGQQVADVIVRQAERMGASLLVLATRAHGAVGRVVFGSVADQVVRASALPVVLVPPRAAAAARREVPIRRLLLPIDGSSVGAGAVEEVLALWAPDGVHCTLVNVAQPDARHVEAAERAETQRRLEEAAARLRDRGFAVECSMVADDDPARGILAAARAGGTDLVAMCTRGRGGLRRLLVGSVAAAVVRDSEVPVMLVVHGRG